MSTERAVGERGYTLVEFAIAMSVFAILMAIVTPLMFSQIRSGLATQERIGLQQNARTALRTMVREIRQASVLYATSDNPSGNDRLSVGVDYDGNGVISTDTAAPMERITYFLKSSEQTLYRGRKFNQGAPLAENVDVIDFTMFGSNLALDADNDGVVEETELNPDGVWSSSELANVTRISIALTVASDDQDQTYEAEAFLRNKVAA
jgi:prepilin-type N-terminal cleavage/methylation domain-containing protein